MTNRKPALSTQETPSAVSLDRALNRLLAELHDGLRHGYFEYVLTCEVIGQERRRLTLRAGKSHQFVIPKGECVRSIVDDRDSHDGGDTDADS